MRKLSCSRKDDKKNETNSFKAVAVLLMAATLLSGVGCASKHNRSNVVKKNEITETTQHSANNSSDQSKTSSEAAAGQPNTNPASASEVASQSASAAGQATAPINASSSSASNSALGSTSGDRSLVSSIDFQPGRKGLTPEATAELNRVIMEAKQKGDIQQVNVAVWSDSEATGAEGRKLPAAQVQLAQQRAQNIQRYIDRMEPSADVRVINMAKKPAQFANFVQSQNPSVKEKLSAMGITSDEISNDLKGRSSSAVVVIQVR